MICKRLVGAVTVRDGWAVQSFGYERYLPLGHPEVVIENLDRWGVDEILVQCIDRTACDLGPDLDLLGRLGRLGITTPLLYAGGIASVEHGVAAVRAGADRICVDAALHTNPALAVALSEQLGAQAVIAGLPLSNEDGTLRWFDHRTRERRAFSNELLEVLSSGAVSETLVIDWQHEGCDGAFDLSLLRAFPRTRTSLIAFGGLGDSACLRAALEMPIVVAGVVGNSLSYREHAVQHLKAGLAGLPLRPAFYETSFPH